MTVSSLPRLLERIVGVVGIFCLGLLLVAGPQQARAEGDTLYGALIMATNAERPTLAPEELRGQAANLRTVFAYNAFRVVGQRRKLVTTRTEDWLVPSRQFFCGSMQRTPWEVDTPSGWSCSRTNG